MAEQITTTLISLDDLFHALVKVVVVMHPVLMARTLREQLVQLVRVVIQTATVFYRVKVLHQVCHF